MCLAHGHNAVTPVKLEPAAPRSRIKHLTTEPMRFHIMGCASKYHITFKPNGISLSYQLDQPMMFGVLFNLFKY